MSGRQLVVVGALVVAALAVALDDDRRDAFSGTGSTSSGTQATKPYVWKVSLDPGGRPYDVMIRRGASVERRPLAVLHAPSRRVMFLGGEYLMSPDEDLYAKRVTLGERPGRLYPVHAIWTVYRDGYEEIVGVVIVERDAPVVRWRGLHDTAYGTDAGLGAITTAEWAGLPEAERGRYERPLIDWQQPSATFDIDGHAGTDTIGFSNGFGDGGFPSVAGYDASGRRAAIAIWSLVVPWRLGFPDGKPPSQVTAARERVRGLSRGTPQARGLDLPRDSLRRGLSRSPVDTLSQS